MKTIKRIFQEIPNEGIREADQQPFLISLGWSRGKTWDDLLQSKRVLIISEAGAGKTYECRSQAKKLWENGEPAFFIDLAALAAENLHSLLGPEEEERLEAWLSSQSDMATFFLDSIDELKLSANKFELALTKLKKGVNGRLGRVRIIITTRPIPFDREVVRHLLPIPPAPSSESNEEKFARLAMGISQESGDRENPKPTPAWQTVGLMPLSDEQIIQFARAESVVDPESLMDDLRRRNAQDFARRPQDLIELCADWREHKRIRTHFEQVETNVRVKLLSRDDRHELAELSIDKAIEGASRLALAMQMTRRLTIRHSAASDRGDDEVAIDPAVILPDWLPNERRALLERPLFTFASYGRVRFHHRSIVEFLAAKRLLMLRGQGMPFRALKRLLFAESRGKVFARPSKRPVVGWLALMDRVFFELLRDHEPSVLLNEGDPESLSLLQKKQALRAYCEMYGGGGARGLDVPQIQVHRFATIELTDEIVRIWESGVANPDVRETLISLIGAGNVQACANIVYAVACDAHAPMVERIFSLDALISLNDKRLLQIAEGIAGAVDLWTDRIARLAVIRLFPKHLSTEQLCRSLRWIKHTKRSVDDLSWQLSRLIAEAKFEPSALRTLRDSLTDLISDGLRWEAEWPHITSNMAHLSAILAATCTRGLQFCRDSEWLRASIIALRLHRREDIDDPIKSLRNRLINLDASDTAVLFWTTDAWLQSVHKTSDPWQRYLNIASLDGPVVLTFERDAEWVSESLEDKERDACERALLLEAARLLPNRESWGTYISGLKALVLDLPELIERINDWLKPTSYDEQHSKWEKEAANRKEQEQHRRSRDRHSWIQFWREIANKPEVMFSGERGWNTAWNLWHAMRHEGENSRSSGWNRRFIEEQFDKKIADKLRVVLMGVWRNDCPTFSSERPEGERNAFLVRWQLGLAAIYAEAEDPAWASKLSDVEARLALRFALIELNGLPQWIEDLVAAHPAIVAQTLGEQLSWEINQPPEAQGYSSLLQGISSASNTVARLFLPRLEIWFAENSDCFGDERDLLGMTARVRQVVDVILKHGDDVEITRLEEVAQHRLENDLPGELVHVWLSTLMRINPMAGANRLEERLMGVTPEKYSEAVTRFANLFVGHRGTVNLGDPRFTSRLLLRLLRLAYNHVRIEHDNHHEGSYSPDVRDDAQQARNAILTALLSAKGDDGWAAKLELAADPLCAHFKDRIEAEAEAKWAEEIDAELFNDAEAAMLDQRREGPASTNQAMFALLRDRLSDLDDLLTRDDSPREAWATISEERVMRRVISRELGHAANLIYTVDQESVTADEKETDIRLRSTASTVEAVIELKLGDNRWSARDLRDTIELQLVNNYMTTENCKSGALLVTLADDRKWDHPDDGHRIGVDELLLLLNAEAERVQRALGNAVALIVHLLDLRPKSRPQTQLKRRRG